MRYALVSPADVVLGFRDYETPPVAVTASTTKPRLLPVVMADVIIDPGTEVKEGPTYVVQPTQVVETYSKRTKSAAEVDAMRVSKVTAVRNEADRRLSSLVDLQRQIHALTRLMQLLYAHVNWATWAQADKDIVTAMVNRLQNIQDIRQKEQTKVAEVEVLTTSAQIVAYDETAGW